MKVWEVERYNPSLGQRAVVGLFRSRKSALDTTLVVIQNDLSDNARWPELQQFHDTSVTVEGSRDFLWIRATFTDNPYFTKTYTISGREVH